MIKNKHTRKTIAIFFLLNFLSTLFPYTALYANNNGPNAPEAAAFEPVDATDMVNLVTGNLSYVLPLLNVPSPEGGYPLSLSYHSGIAVDQEASWVGLGWNLNPGAINRGVNGYPDDWGRASISEFFYDKGWSDDYYSFSAGVTIKNSISVGLGLSWGSNQSLGGYVSASIGVEGGSIGGYIGTNGVGITGGIGQFNVSAGTDGIGVGYGTKGDASLGVNLNYSYSSGLSGGIDITKKKRDAKNNIVAGESTGLGFSFSSKGASLNAKVNGLGAGISSSGSSISMGDYDVTTASSGFTIPLIIFYIGYNHTNVRYSLFKKDFINTSGILYPYEGTKLKDENSYYSRELLNNNFMDVNVLFPFKEGDTYDKLLDNSNTHKANNLILPNYDNFSVNAQGISGNLTPYIEKSFNLSGRGTHNTNQNGYTYVDYLNKDFDEYKGIESVVGQTPREIDKNYFTFSNTYNSFLRTEKENLSADLLNNVNINELNGRVLLNELIYQDSNNYNSILNNRKKREGNTIITYTNREIRQGNLPGFIEAKEGVNTLNRQDINVFLDKGIGAFQVTSLDGKTYHYSLPVYQFENVYKNFKKVNGRGDDVYSENDNFFEIRKNTPYATHWLLTGITGPDYIDTNNNNKLDKEDYGYWVEFDYGKWSDGYIWRTPSGRVEENVNKLNPEDKTYSYAWGRKQIYYLDAVKTRTHTALFIKGKREDNISSGKLVSSSEASYDPDIHTPEVLGKSLKKFQKKERKVWNFSNQYTIKDNYHSEDYPTPPYPRTGAASVATFEYTNYPKVKSLKLEKIILVDNKKISDNINKIGVKKIEEKVKGYSLKIDGLSDLNYGGYIQDHHLFHEKPVEKIKKSIVYSHLSDKILDSEDIKGLELDKKASQVIEFEYYDKGLVQGAPNTTNGKLSLKKLHFKGKEGIGVIPPYEFFYGSNYFYNKNDIDSWGYHKNVAAAWSLNKIKTPTGGEIKMNYENDEFRAAIDDFTVFQYNGSFYKSTLPTTESNGKSSITLSIDSGKEIPNTLNIELGSKIDIKYRSSICSFNTITESQYNSTGTVTQIIDDRNFKVSFDNNINTNYYNNTSCGGSSYSIINLKAYAYKNKDVGGGLRTKSIVVNDGIKDIVETSYFYEDGITSYAPSKEQKGVPYMSELPAPMVLYGKVEMHNKDGNDKYLGKTVYNFETLKERGIEEGYIFSLGECFRVKEEKVGYINQGYSGKKVNTNKYTIESKLGDIGRINSVIKYNSFGQLLSKIKNNYKGDLDNDGEIGVHQETHTSYKRYRYKILSSEVDRFYVSSTSKIDYPSVLESVEETSGGLTKTKYFDKYDFLTGQVLETRTYASDGKAFKSKMIPAYTKYQKMGSKVDDITNKNMLSQVAAEYNYIYKDNDWKVANVGITTWKNNWTYQLNDRTEKSSTDIWRKHKTYLWKGAFNSDGTYNFTDDFVWTVDANQSSNWQETSHVTRYNQFSQPLEVKDINGNYVSTKYGDNYSKVIATSSAAYDEMYYSGAEHLAFDNVNYFDGGIKSTNYRIVTNKEDAHTGMRIVEAPQGAKAFEVTVPARSERNTILRQRFKVSVWVKKGQENNLKINVGSSTGSFNDSEDVQAGNWVMKQGYVTIPSGATTISIESINGTVQLDDFRLHPATSTMMTYVYNEWDEVSFITGANGLSTHYIYDAAGRLKETRVEVVTNTDVTPNIDGGFVKVSTNSYNYKKNQ
ncbi:hypothetical protein [Tenacibaculum aiptasiae]|uniref:hypothetical protein n=1 Tax=Tenacibaculum aiptasiae TaxID=426481 RepID=UPI003B5B7161